jgi:hypothetical protein
MSPSPDGHHCHGSFTVLSPKSGRKKYLTESDDMTTDGSSWNAIMQYSFLHVFANDGLIDREELQMLERLALRDGEVDERERDVLARVFARVKSQAVDPSVLEEINRFKAQFRIP